MNARIRWGRFLSRLAAILIVAGLLLALPEPADQSVVPIKNAVICLLAVILVGVLIYNTFFYDRYSR
jgi:uncharacterized membrane protein